MSNELHPSIRRHIATHQPFTAAEELAATRAVWTARESAWSIVLGDNAARTFAASASPEPLKTALMSSDATAARVARLDHDDETLRAAVAYLSRSDAAKVRRHLGALDRAVKHVEAHNIALVVSYVHERFINLARAGMCDFGDLVGYGTIGLHSAALRFDPAKGWRFSTYACWWIRHAIGRAIADTLQTIRIPVHLRDSLPKIRKAIAEIERRGEQATDEAVARLVGKSAKQVATARAAMSLGVLVSLGAAVRSDDGGDRTELHALLPDDREEARADFEADKDDDRASIDRALCVLTSRERHVITHRSGLADDGPGEGLREIGEELGISRERVRQIELLALSKMRRAMGAGVGAVC